MLLRIQHLRLSLQGNEILHDVNLELGQGQIYGLLGPNGAGKSSTINAVLGLLPREAGTITIFDRAVDGDTSDLRQRLGVLPEQNGFYDWMNAEDYLGLFAALYGKQYARPEIDARLSAVGVRPRAGQPIGTFSRGMRQRLGIARGLISDPQLLILDEPTNGLDPRGRREIHDILLGLAKNGVGILLSTHLLDDVERLCQRVGIIVDGHTVAEGPITDLIHQSGNVYRYRLRLAGKPPERDPGSDPVRLVSREGDWWLVDIKASTTVDDVWRELFARNWPIAEIRRESGGLEEVYLALTERQAA